MDLDSLIAARPASRSGLGAWYSSMLQIKRELEAAGVKLTAEVRRQLL